VPSCISGLEEVVLQYLRYFGEREKEYSKWTRRDPLRLDYNL